MALKDKYYCWQCDKLQPWWRFSFLDVDKFDKDELKWIDCVKHYNVGVPKEKRLENTLLRHRIERLLKRVDMSDKNIHTMRETLFATMDKLLKNEIEIPRAQAIVSVAQTIINSAKVEVDILKLLDPEKRESRFLLPEKTTVHD